MAHFLLSAAHKSSGKTTLSIGLCAALQSRGLEVRPFKKGPDYIDPMWLSVAAQNDCYNLDFYTMEREEIVSTFWEKMLNMDIGIIEGNKGLYDGLDLDGSNSNAALAKLLNTPVILVLDARGMTRGIAPLILGYQAFDKELNIAGVILNKIGGARHESKLRSIIEHYTDLAILGAVSRSSELEITERHLGLVPSSETGQVTSKIQNISSLIDSQVDIDGLISITTSQESPAFKKSLPEKNQIVPGVRIAIAKDSAFGFYYPGDLEALESAGAQIVHFDTLKDSHLPEADGLFIGGGFPETHMKQLEANSSLRQDIHSKIDSGLPTYAECGGLMYLCRSISWNGESSQMVGILPADVEMHSQPQGRGYIQLKETGKGLWSCFDPKIDKSNMLLSGHEFHYSSLQNLDPNLIYAYDIARGFGIDGHHDGIVYKNLQANYAHLRNVKRSPWASNFIQFVRDRKTKT